MRQPVPLRERINLRLIALFIALLGLCLFGALYNGGHARPAPLGVGWSCTPNILGTVCVKDPKNTTVRG